MTLRAPFRNRLLGGGAILVPLLLTGLVSAAPMLHEYFELGAPEPEAASGLGAAAGEGLAPPSPSGNGPRSAPPTDVQRGDGAGTDSYRLDSNTTRPEQVGYEDPFTPAIPPFKRLYAYDAVDAEFELVVRDPSYVPFAVGGSVQPATDDQFYGELSVALVAGAAVRVPSVGPDARVLAARLEPAAPFEFLRDSADNWYVRSAQTGSPRLFMHLAVDRSVFGSPFADPGWRDLASLVPTLAPHVQRRGLEVADGIGVSRASRPREALARLVAHFRSFSPSEETPSIVEPGALFREIALSKKGVCRHRSYAFTVTALSLGLPTRFVRNEAHAWVEVNDARTWHRIDLGGAAGEMQLASNVDVAHVPPSDPFEWPTGSESGTDMTDAAMRGNDASGGSGSARGSGTAEPSSSATEVPAEGSARVRPPLPATAGTSALPLPSEPATVPTTGVPAESPLEPARPEVSLDPHADVVMQGGRVHLAGRVVTERPCPLLRVDVVLRSAERTIPVGSLVADAQGRYAGAINLPSSVPVGDYQLEVLPHDAASCVETP